MKQQHAVITLRDSRPEDLADIQRIYAHHVERGTSSFEEIAPDVNELATRRQSVLDIGMPHIVAELNGKVQGFAYANRFRPRSAYRYTVEDSIYVEPAATGNGIGTQLLTELIERCTRLGFRQMIAVIGGAGNLASINLHKRLGFTVAGQLKATGFKFGTWVDTILMQRALGDGDTTLPEKRP
ncbi:MAG: GNAT family N-acetyltransferase [Rhodospirillales bacterium]|nr:GNAT family N-acetyltransferase [Rhodospirillales bacterium]